MERLVDLVTPLGDALWFRQMTGTEALSLPFELDVVMHSKSSGLSAKAVLGKPFTLKVATEQPGAQRFFNGICTRFASAGREGRAALGDGPGPRRARSGLRVAARAAAAAPG